MRRWIFAIALLIAAMPAALADGHKHGRGRGHDKHHDRRYYRNSYRHDYGRNYYPRARTQVYYQQRFGPSYYAAPGYRHWVPAYAPVPMGYRTRIMPVPVGYYEDYGPVPYGCRRGMIDGYVVDYRPSNFLVVNFSKVW